MQDAYADSRRPRIQCHPNINEPALRRAKEKIAPGMKDDEMPLVLIDMIGPGRLFDAGGSEGVLLTTRALYENVSWYESTQRTSMILPWERLHSIESHSPYSGEQRVLVNGIPLFGIFKTFREHDAPFRENLHKAMTRILAGLSHEPPMPLEDIVKSYETFGLLKSIQSSHPNLAAEGLAKAGQCFPEFNEHEDRVLFYRYQKKSFLSNEEHLLITDKALFSYDACVETDHYQYWNLSAIDEVRVEHYYFCRYNQVGVYINNAFLYGTAHQDYADRVVRFFCIYEEYALAALICEILNTINGGARVFPTVLTEVDDGAEYHKNRGPLRHLRTTDTSARKTSPSKESSNQGGDCFVVTAVYGRRDHPIVLRLRQWRDLELRKHKWGRVIIFCYGKVGPIMARYIRKHPRLRKTIAFLLDGVVRKHHA